MSKVATVNIMLFICYFDNRCAPRASAITFYFTGFFFYVVKFQPNKDTLSYKNKVPLYDPTRPVAIMRVLPTVLFLLIAHKGTKAKPKPKPEPKPKPHNFWGAGHPGGDYSLNIEPNILNINGRLEKGKFSYCDFI